MTGRQRLNLKTSRRRSQRQQPPPFTLPSISGGLAALLLSPFVAYGFALQYFAAAFDIGDGRIEADFFFRLSGVVLGMGVGAVMMFLGFFLAHDLRRSAAPSGTYVTFGRFFGGAFALLLFVLGFWLLQVSFDGWGLATGLIREALDA